MPKRRTLFIPGGYYHLYNRGVSKRNIFLEESDYRRFLNNLAKEAKNLAIKFYCYCLMPNHFHFLIKQAGEKSVSQFMQKTMLAYAMYFNTKYENVGPIYQGRFKAKLVENENYLLHLSRYIHQNPMVLTKKRKGKVPYLFIRHYQWSSYRYYCYKRKKPPEWLKRDLILNYFSKTNKSMSYQNFTETVLFNEDLEKIKGLVLE